MSEQAEDWRAEIPWSEWLGLVRRIGHLEGAIEAHRILTRGQTRIEDTILYGLLEEEGDE